jgi:hypothetical protein
VVALGVLQEVYGLSTSWLARSARLDRSHLSRVLSGKRPLTSDVLGACFVALGQEIRRREAAR